MSGKYYLEKIREMLDRIEGDQWPQIEKAATLVADLIAEGGVVHIFGSGHTHILAEEVWCRAGGLAAVSPILDPDQMPYTGPFKGSALEKLEGFGTILFETHDARPKEVIIVVSNSGRNPVPIEIAMAAKERGLTVIALTSMDYSRNVSSRHSSGKRLFELADLVIDNCSPMGDATVELEGLLQKVGPTSTVTNAIILNAIVVEAATKLLERGIEPPIFVSANLDVSMDLNMRFIERYRDRVHLFDRYPGQPSSQ